MPIMAATRSSSESLPLSAAHHQDFESVGQRHVFFRSDLFDAVEIADHQDGVVTNRGVEVAGCERLHDLKHDVVEVIVDRRAAHASLAKLVAEVFSFPGKILDVVDERPSGEKVVPVVIVELRLIGRILELAGRQNRSDF